MTREKGKNTAASIRARLLALAQSTGEDYQRVLGRYAIERFLYRLGRSPYSLLTLYRLSAQSLCC